MEEDYLKNEAISTDFELNLSVLEAEKLNIFFFSFNIVNLGFGMMQYLGRVCNGILVYIFYQGKLK